ncbi:GRAS transcription factor [Trema orientale]|uniref:GRAS transcription factor n=1 Tax=Trema orientale TaxID=63057 RepID=A0A2P5FGW3_TREOI|nr:GRAS transcription factor [Trema orientale]
MQSGFTGAGGLPDFYTGGRSTIATTMNNNPSQPSPFHRSQLPGLFLDPTTPRIARQNPIPTTLIGKRTLAEFQSHQQYQPNLGLAQASYLRSVKPRTYQQSSPISPLSPIEFSPTTTTGPESSSTSSSQRFGLPLLQHLRPQPVSAAAQGVPYVNNPVQNRVPAVDSDKKMMNHRLQELEKELLDDIDEGEGDPVSAITNNSSSEWSETIQNLISPNQTQKPVSPSPTSSSSSSSSSSVASPASSTCSKQSLMEAASAISEGKPEAASEILTRLTQVSNPRPNSEQRVLEFIASALKSRVNPGEILPPVMELFSQEHAASTKSLYDLSPCFGLGFTAANLAILEATLADQSSSKNKVHVIDFDIGHGGQYVNLLHQLRPNGKPVTLKITTVADNCEKLKSVGDQLSQFAERFGFGFELSVRSQKISELSRDSLGCEPDEPLAVNFAFKLYRMPDESVSTENPRDELLRRVKALAPRVVTLVEQELNTNTAPFMARVNETCAYYGALLDSVDSTVPMENPDRVRVEDAVSRKIANSVACEGRDRFERCEVFGKWRARMGMAGFESKPLSQNVRTRVSSGTRLHPGFSVKEENGGICFGWMGRTLTVASAWR